MSICVSALYYNRGQEIIKVDALFFSQTLAQMGRIFYNRNTTLKPEDQTYEEIVGSLCGFLRLGHGCR